MTCTAYSLIQTWICCHLWALGVFCRLPETDLYRFWVDFFEGALYKFFNEWMNEWTWTLLGFGLRHPSGLPDQPQIWVGAKPLNKLLSSLKVLSRALEILRLRLRGLWAHEHINSRSHLSSFQSIALIQLSLSRFDYSQVQLRALWAKRPFFESVRGKK